jgi:hypothetical protein
VNSVVAPRAQTDTTYADHLSMGHQSSKWAIKRFALHPQPAVFQPAPFTEVLQVMQVGRGVVVSIVLPSHPHAAFCAVVAGRFVSLGAGSAVACHAAVAGIFEAEVIDQPVIE